MHDAGFRWAPKQALFVAPAWTPGREDVLLSLAGEIEDEDSTLAERQEARAERFTGYSGKRASESAQALDEVERLAAMIPPGQPILVGHHSERRARRDAQRIENGMKRAVMLFERAEYWEERARSALIHAKYKERPDVRWRRIKKIEADLRKAEKTIAQSQKYLTMWRAESLDLNMAKLISSHDRISACFPLDTYPRPAEKSQYEGSRSLWSALDDDIITTEQAREIAIRCHERQIQHQQRWVNHYQNRLIYERAMLDESGGVVTRTQDFEPGGQVFQPGRVADHHPREQKQRGGEFSHNAKLQFPRVQRHDESDARSHHGLQSTIGRRGCRRQSGREASAGSQLSGGRFPGNDKGVVGRPAPGL
ncbi:Domain of uncharacterised function (DUF3560) [Escherichia coli]|nr:Domain of uncharacterised function (DUF3560) [Escherichia coli]